MKIVKAASRSATQNPLVGEDARHVNDSMERPDNATRAAKIVPIMVHSGPIGKQARVFGPLSDADGPK